MIFGRPLQLGLVVRNLDDAMHHWGQVTGVKGFLRVDTDYAARYKGREVHVANRNAFAPWGGEMMLEIIEPGRHEGMAWDWLENRGEGLFHLGYATDDMSQRYPAKGLACEVLKPPYVVFLDTVDAVGYYVELIPTDLADTLLDRVRAAAAAVS